MASSGKAFLPISENELVKALTGISRAINLLVTYGEKHPAFSHAYETAYAEIQPFFGTRKKLVLGAFNGVMTIDEVPVKTEGSLIKSLEKRLSQLQITGLRICENITEDEMRQLIILLSSGDTEAFNDALASAELSNVVSEETHFAAVHSGETVADVDALLGGGEGEGVLILDDEFEEFEEEENLRRARGHGDGTSIHVEQIVAFLKGDVESVDEETGKELENLASDPDRLGRMIMESVAIRQAVSELSGESLSDVILGCLRRTYDGLRKRPAFRTQEGMADLKKALLLLEESVLDRMRDISGNADAELDRKIVQAIREMDENLGFEMAAGKFIENKTAIEASRKELESYVRSHGADKAGELLEDKDFPSREWRRIVIDSNPAAASALPVASGLNTLVTVLEKLEGLMKSGKSDDETVNRLINEASSSLGSASDSTHEKLELLSQALQEHTGTIGGQALKMDRKELLSTIAEIAQELMQPLTAMNVSLEMLLGGYAGEVSPEQHDMLYLASKSGDNLRYLMRQLIDIVGLPINLGVDKRFSTPHETLPT